MRTNDSPYLWEPQRFPTAGRPGLERVGDILARIWPEIMARLSRGALLRQPIGCEPASRSKSRYLLADRSSDRSRFTGLMPTATPVPRGNRGR